MLVKKYKWTKFNRIQDSICLADALHSNILEEVLLEVGAFPTDCATCTPPFKRNFAVGRVGGCGIARLRHNTLYRQIKDVLWSWSGSILGYTECSRVEGTVDPNSESNIVILTDSQAAVKALYSEVISSRLVEVFTFSKPTKTTGPCVI